MSGEVLKTVGQWVVRVIWKTDEDGTWIKAFWDSNDSDGESEWYFMVEEYPPTQMINTPGDDESGTPGEIQQTVWDLCDYAWEEWRQQTIATP